MAGRTGHTPERTCRVCREKHPQKKLQRWVVIDGVASHDASGKLPGRGWYACSKPECQNRITQVAAGQARARSRTSQRNK